MHGAASSSWSRWRPYSCRSSWPPIGWRDVVDIAIVSILVYEVLTLIRGTRAVQMAVGAALERLHRGGVPLLLCLLLPLLFGLLEALQLGDERVNAWIGE